MKKIHIEHSLLNQLSCLKICEDNYQTEPTSEIENLPARRYLRISLFSNDDDEKNNLFVSKTVPNVYNVRVKNIMDYHDFLVSDEVSKRILQVIKEEVQNYGTLYEIRLVGHGTPGMIGQESYLNLRQVMKAVSELEMGLNCRIAGRIVFDACNTFAKLNDDDIKYYSDFAKQHHVEIVGATSETAEMNLFLGKHVRCGRYVQFSPNSRIFRDKLDTRYNPNMLFLSNDRSWTDFYLDRSVEEGYRAKKAYEHQLKKDMTEFQRTLDLEKFGPKL